MTDHVVVFVGPSLPLDHARASLAADYRPPARRGDIERAANDGAQTILLIDGYLIHEYPPSPMEVFHVLKRGVRVIGAASLGALRAVELRDHGMLGIGWVHEQFACGAVDADDEIVVACDSRDGRALTVPLINVRFALKNLYKRGQAGEEVAEAFEKVAALYLEDRTTEAIRRALAQVLSRDALEAMFSPAYDIKAKDAREALLRIAAEQLSAARIAS
jgi:TfuA protein